MKKLRINRKTWNRNRIFNALSSLRDNKGKMCCLGFYGLQICKLKVCDILNQTSPYCVITNVLDNQTNLDNYTHRLKKLLKKSYEDSGYYNNDVCENLMAINDVDLNTKFMYRFKNGKSSYKEIKSEKHRESLIIKEFNKIDVEVNFYN